MEANAAILEGIAAELLEATGCAYELGHWAVKRAAEPNTEAGARYLAGAFTLPRRAFERDLGTTCRRIDALQRRQVNASAEMVARRIVTLRNAVTTIIDNGKVPDRVVSPWLEDPRLRRLSRWERGLADQAPYRFPAALSCCWWICSMKTGVR